MVECLPRTQEALGSVPSTTERQRGREGEKRERDREHREVRVIMLIKFSRITS